MIQVPGYGDHLAATTDPSIHERQASAPAGFADVIGGLVVIRTDEAARWHVTFTVADRDEQRRCRGAARRRRSSARPTTCGQSKRSCATRKAQSSRSASSPHRTSTERPSSNAAYSSIRRRGRRRITDLFAGVVAVEEVRRHGAEDVPDRVALDERVRVAQPCLAGVPDGEGDQDRRQRGVRVPVPRLDLAAGA